MVSRTALSASVADFLSPRRPESASIRSRLFMFTPAFPHGRPRLWHLAGPRPLTSPKLGDQAALHNNLAEYCPRVGAFPSCFSDVRQTCPDISGSLSDRGADAELGRPERARARRAASGGRAVSLSGR